MSASKTMLAMHSDWFGKRAFHSLSWQQFF
jgi:hypothetical protein